MGCADLAIIDRRQLKALTVFRPPLSEQRHIAACLNNLQARVDVVKRQQTATTLNALLPSILAQALPEGIVATPSIAQKAVPEIQCGNRANRK